MPADPQVTSTDPQVISAGPQVISQAAYAERRAGTPLSDTAALHGYADYAHLYRDAQQFYGQSPAALTGQPVGA